MPILGIIASQNYPRVTNSYESIATANGTGSSDSITFSSIPSTYTHLQIRMIGKGSANATGGSDITIDFNSDTTYTNYYSHRLQGDGSSATASSLQLSGYYVYVGQVVASDAGQTSMMSAAVIDILDYKNTNKYKTVRNLLGYDLNGSGRIYFASGLWKSTSAISTIRIATAGGTNFTTSTQIALYGIKG